MSHTYMPAISAARSWLHSSSSVEKALARRSRTRLHSTVESAIALSENTKLNISEKSRCSGDRLKEGCRPPVVLVCDSIRRCVCEMLLSKKFWWESHGA